VANATVTSEASSRKLGTHPGPPQQDDPVLEALVREIIGRVADKWTMLALEVLSDHGRLRFTRLGELIGGVSQKMLTKTLRQMEADGLSLGEAFCGVWIWAERHREAILQSRKAFSHRTT
jgi:hypothetical protein